MSRLLVFFLLMAYTTPYPCAGMDWLPTEEELKTYRKTWNPLSHGPVLLQSVDTQPKGQFSFREVFFAQTSASQFGNQLSLPTEAKNTLHLTQISPSILGAFGLTDHIEAGVSVSTNSWWTNNQGSQATSSGLGDTSLNIKYRPIIQDPESWRPTLVHYTQVVLPSSRWANTEKPSGGFSPLGRLPATRFGEFGITQGLMTRKNLEPIRISGAIFYTYALPGENNGSTTYTGDLINTRLIFEHILDDRNGFGYNIEVSTLHGLTWRGDGHEINAGLKHGFTIIGVQPALQWNISDNFLVAFGCQFTVAGQNAVNAVYPNFSLFWFPEKNGKIIMR